MPSQKNVTEPNCQKWAKNSTLTKIDIILTCLENQKWFLRNKLLLIFYLSQKNVNSSLEVSVYEGLIAQSHSKVRRNEIFDQNFGKILHENDVDEDLPSHETCQLLKWNLPMCTAWPMNTF